MVWRIIRVIYPVFFILISAHAENIQILDIYPHNTMFYTQGFFMKNGYFYESTGMKGQSALYVYSPDGKIIKKQVIHDSYFGEGLAYCDGKIVQLTWKSGIALVYNENLEFTGKYAYEGEGWGLTSDTKSFIMSNGSEYLYFRNPHTFHITRKLKVTYNGKPLQQLNELEYIQGKIYANIWYSTCIAVIHPKTGVAEQMIDLSSVCKEAEDRENGSVLNGIAYDEYRKTVYITGKRWKNIYVLSGVVK